MTTIRSDAASALSATTLASLNALLSEAAPSRPALVPEVPDDLPKTYGQPIAVSDAVIRPERVAALSGRLMVELWADALAAAAGRAGAQPEGMIQPYPLAERIRVLAAEGSASQAEMMAALQALTDALPEFGMQAADVIHARALAGEVAASADVDPAVLVRRATVSVTVARSSLSPAGSAGPVPVGAADALVRWDVVTALGNRSVNALWAGFDAGLRAAEAAEATAEMDVASVAHRLEQSLRIALDPIFSGSDSGANADEREAAVGVLRSMLPGLADALAQGLTNAGAVKLDARTVQHILDEALAGPAAVAQTVKMNSSVDPPAGTPNLAILLADAMSGLTSAFAAAFPAQPELHALTTALIAAGKRDAPQANEALFHQMGDSLQGQLSGVVDSILAKLAEMHGPMTDAQRSEVQTSVQARIQMALLASGAVQGTREQHATMWVAAVLSVRVRDIVAAEGAAGLQRLLAFGGLQPLLAEAFRSAVGQMETDPVKQRQLLDTWQQDAASVALYAIEMLPGRLLSASQQTQLEAVMASEIRLAPSGFVTPADPAAVFQLQLQQAIGSTLQGLYSKGVTLTTDRIAEAVKPAIDRAIAGLINTAGSAAERLAQFYILDAATAQASAIVNRAINRVLDGLPVDPVAPLVGNLRGLVQSVLQNTIEPVLRSQLDVAKPAFLENPASRKLAEQLVGVYDTVLASGATGAQFDEAFLMAVLWLRDDGKISPADSAAIEANKAFILANGDAIGQYAASVLIAKHGLSGARADDLAQSVRARIGYVVEGVALKDAFQFIVAALLWAPVEGAVFKANKADTADLQALLSVGGMQSLLVYSQAYMVDQSRVMAHFESMAQHLPLPDEARKALINDIKGEIKLMDDWRALPSSPAGDFAKTLVAKLGNSIQAAMRNSPDGGPMSFGTPDEFKAIVEWTIVDLKNAVPADEIRQILGFAGGNAEALVDMVVARVAEGYDVSPAVKGQLIRQLADITRETIREAGVDTSAAGTLLYTAKYYRADIMIWIQQLMRDSKAIMYNQSEALTKEMQARTQKMGYYQKIIECLNELVSFTAKDAASGTDIPIEDDEDVDDNGKYYRRSRELATEMYLAYNQLGEGPAVNGLTGYWNEYRTIPVARVRKDDPRLKEAGTIVLNDYLLRTMDPNASNDTRIVHAATFDALSPNGAYADRQRVMQDIADGYIYIQDRTLYTKALFDPRTGVNDEERDGYESTGMNYFISVGSHNAVTREKATNTSEVFSSRTDQAGRLQSMASQKVNNASNMMSEFGDAVSDMIKKSGELTSSLIMAIGR